jgi:hypothetical protein
MLRICAACRAQMVTAMSDYQRASNIPDPFVAGRVDAWGLACERLLMRVTHRLGRRLQWRGMGIEPAILSGGRRTAEPVAVPNS